MTSIRRLGTSHGVTCRKVWGRLKDVTLGRPQDVMFQCPKVDGRRRPQDVGKGRLLALNRLPYSDIYRTSFGDVLRTSSERNVAKWVCPKHGLRFY